MSKKNKSAKSVKSGNSEMTREQFTQLIAEKGISAVRGMTAYIHASNIYSHRGRHNPNQKDCYIAVEIVDYAPTKSCGPMSIIIRPIAGIGEAVLESACNLIFSPEEIEKADRLRTLHRKMTADRGQVMRGRLVVDRIRELKELVNSRIEGGFYHPYMMGRIQEFDLDPAALNLQNKHVNTFLDDAMHVLYPELYESEDDDDCC